MPQALQLLGAVCIIAWLLLPGRPMLCPEPGRERVFMHPQVAGRLRARLTRFDGEFHRTFLTFGRRRGHRWLTHRTHLLRIAMALVSVCPEEYSHIMVLRHPRGACPDPTPVMEPTPPRPR